MTLRSVGDLHGTCKVIEVIEISRIARKNAASHSFHFGNDGLQMSQEQHERIKVRNGGVFLPLSQCHGCETARLLKWAEYTQVSTRQRARVRQGCRIAAKATWRVSRRESISAR